MEFYFKTTSSGQNFGGSLLNCTKIPLIVMYWKSRLGVDFKIESVLQARRKENEILCMATVKMGGATVTLNKTKSKEGQCDYLDKTEVSSKKM